MSTTKYGIKEIYLTILGLLPLLALIALFHSDANWHLVVTNLKEETTAGFIFIFYSFVGFFISGIFGLLFVQLNPYPKSHLLGIIMLVDTPIELMIIHLMGGDFTIDQYLILDFLMESAGLVLACFLIVLLQHKNLLSENKTLYIIVALQGLTIVTGVYLFLSISWLESLSLIKQVPIYLGVLGTIILYYRVFAEHNREGKKIETKNIPAKITTFALVACWGYVVAGIIVLNF